jgi:hypothetical protein
MHLRIVTFDLDGITAADNAPIAEAMAPQFAAWPGLITKFWIANDDATTLGGVYVFDDRSSAEGSRRTAEFAAVVDNPHFSNFRVSEYAVIDSLTAVTAGPFADEIAAGAQR